MSERRSRCAEWARQQVAQRSRGRTARERMIKALELGRFQRNLSRRTHTDEYEKGNDDEAH